MISANENARRQPGADAAETYTVKDTTGRGVWRQVTRAIIVWFLNRRCVLCDLLCGDRFLNRHASLEIDWLTVEVENLQARLRESERVNQDIERQPGEAQTRAEVI